MNTYWEKVWDNQDLAEYRGYIENHMKSKPAYLQIFYDNNVKYICDAACGFGAYSAMLATNGFQTGGFDVVGSSIELTRQLLTERGIDTSEYIVSGITTIGFPSATFDAVVAHAVIDHLSLKDAHIALEELLRIIKEKGFVYLSFDGMEEDDLALEHTILEDGSFLYSDKSRDGLLFHCYQESEINHLLEGKQIIYRNVNTRGDREVIIQKV